jgi:hypothetical protein
MIFSLIFIYILAREIAVLSKLADAATSSRIFDQKADQTQPDADKF